MQHIGEAMSKAQQSAGPSHEQPQASSQGENQGKNDDIEEAEVEIIDDEEKK